jgi:hypothetical protein
MQMKNIRKLALFIIVLSITVNGIWCIWDYLSLLRVRSFGDALAHILVFGGGISLCFIPILGIWMGWSGLWNVVNAGGQDWDRSVGYMKIIGGAALIIITNLFLYILAG